MDKIETNKKDYIRLCGFNVFAKSKEKCLEDILSREKVHIVSGNPEVLYAGIGNFKLHSNFKSKDTLIIPDGVGLQVSAKLNRKHIEEKIAGIDLMDNIVEFCSKNKKSIFLLGATDESLEKCSYNLLQKYKELNICGVHNGFFSKENEANLLDYIESKKPFAIFVAMGCPMQEEFIIENMDNLSSKIFMGVGGSFDVIGGVRKRAPKIMINAGLEWAYRVYKEPFRFKRLGIIPKFILKSLSL